MSDFLPKAGGAYAARRNHDLPGHPHVSGLSPYVRHRLVSEDEVVRAVLGRFARSTAEKFLQEVYWRTYWKGWMERRPETWVQYRADVRHGLNRVQTESGLRREWEAACRGETGIDAFDHWARQLVETGYLHNHARMWFASIWVFTLRLPWALGADFFLRHLLDGDPASNTLGWRWVAGLQTIGKTYLARPDNIARYTDGRFRPAGLATEAIPPGGPPHPPPGPVPVADQIAPDLRTGLLLHEEDLSVGWLLDICPAPVATAVLDASADRSPLSVSGQVTDFTEGAIADSLLRHAPRLGEVGRPEDLGAWARAHRLEQIVTAHAPQGPARERIEAWRRAGVPIRMGLRPSDAAAWPHAAKGFFAFKQEISGLLDRLRVT
ncbi:FAD-binding domain-containing protein [Roseisalinus antarcticus]|uniref:FAD-binding domain-containing protein n=1 Tax=Roseisalinus antarcticus TaxID=254357 RepID=UPI001F1DFAC7|nr:FAD-binding domain-containing protein [Roseisalinus antarcticus]